MIWLTNALGGVRWHGKAVVDGECQCAACLVERSDGLLGLGPVRASDYDAMRRLEDRGYVGVYRVIPKPWKRG